MLQALTTLLDYFRDERHRNEDRVDTAIAALYATLNETLVYVKREYQTSPSTETEQELSRLWFKAAAAVRRVDVDLAERCLMKGRYWLDPDTRTAEYVAENRIDLERVFEDVRNLMRGAA